MADPISESPKEEFPAGSLPTVAADYESDVDALDRELSRSDRDAVMCVLLRRDQVATLLKNLDVTSSPIVNQINTLDQRLKAQALRICAAIGSQAFDEWRLTLNPPTAAWWWFLDSEADTRSTPRLLVFLFGVGCFSLMAALVTDLVRRFFVGGPDSTSLPYIIAQSLAAVATGTAFTEAGARWIEQLLFKYGIRRFRAKEWRIVSVVFFLGVTVMVWTKLDAIATYYDHAGVRLAAAGQITTAIHRFERSIALAPDRAVAHYNLASAYEDLGESEKALVEYYVALKTDATFVPAYNNAARILIRKHDPGTALQLIETALSKPTSEPGIRYSLWKNRGAAHLELNQLLQAEDDLHEALRNSDGAEANCLMGQIIQKKGGDARWYWQHCLSSVSTNEKPDPLLTSFAEEELRSKEREKAKK